MILRSGPLSDRLGKNLGPSVHVPSPGCTAVSGPVPSGLDASTRLLDCFLSSPGRAGRSAWSTQAEYSGTDEESMGSMRAAQNEVASP